MAYSQACDSLEAPCLGTFSRNGYYFDLEAVNDIRVTGLNYLVQNAGTRDVSLWYRTGTYFGFEGVASNWTPIGTDSNITPANALNCPLPLNRILQDFNICIPAGQKYGFYLSVSSGTGTVETHNNLSEGTIATQDVNVKLITGKGQFGIGNFSGTLMGGLTFQGSVRYSCQCANSSRDLTDDNKWFLFPNPATDEINILNGAAISVIPEISSAILLNALGKAVKIFTPSAMDKRDTHFDVSGISPGIYFLRLNTAHGSRVYRFIRE